MTKEEKRGAVLALTGTMTPEGKPMTAKEIAERTGVNMTTVYSLWKQEGIPTPCRKYVPPLTEEKKDEILGFLRKTPDLSFAAVARMTGVSAMTVTRIARAAGIHGTGQVSRRVPGKFREAVEYVKQNPETPTARLMKRYSVGATYVSRVRRAAGVPAELSHRFVGRKRDNAKWASTAKRARKEARDRLVCRLLLEYHDVFPGRSFYHAAEEVGKVCSVSAATVRQAAQGDEAVMAAYPNTQKKKERAN